MPDMTQKGAHVEVLLDDWRFRAEQYRKQAARAEARAEAFEEAVAELKRALSEEALKQL